MKKFFDKKIKKLDVWDVGLAKFAVAAATLFIITIWPAAMAWVKSVNPWYFLAAWVIFAIKPFLKVFGK